MIKEILLANVQKLARPLIGICLRHGIKLGEIVDALKRVYVSCAEESLLREGDAVSISRISLMTGVHRTDVATIRSEEQFTPRERHTASDVISQWRFDPRFSSRRGHPRALDYEGKDSEFAELVRSVSLSVSPYTVRFELERMGLVTVGKGGKLKLISRAFVAKGDPEMVLDMLGEDAEDLYSSVEENAFFQGEGEAPNHHLKTEYSNIPSEALPEIRQWISREGSAFHERARNYISKFDRDISGRSEAGGGKHRVAICSFSRIDSHPLPSKERSQKKERE